MDKKRTYETINKKSNQIFTLTTDVFHTKSNSLSLCGVAANSRSTMARGLMGVLRLLPCQRSKMIITTDATAATVRFFFIQTVWVDN
jgi:pantothenate kinase